MRSPSSPAWRGPLPPLPSVLDDVARRWAGVSGRVRLVVRAGVVAVLLVAAGGGLVRGPWGPPVAVVVTTGPIAAGTLLTAADTAVERRPASLVPAGAYTDDGAVPADAVAVGPMPAGAVVTPDVLVGGGPAGLATAGSALVAVDAALLPPLPVGTRLDVAVPTVDGGATIAARDAEVVADDGAWRWLRVARRDVAALAAGISDGRLVPAVLPVPPTGAP